MESSSKSKIFRKFVFFNEKRCFIQSNEEMKKLYYVKSVHFSAQWWDLPVFCLVYTVGYRSDGELVNPTSVQCTEISVKVDLPQTIFPCKVAGKSRAIYTRRVAGQYGICWLKKELAMVHCKCFVCWIHRWMPANQIRTQLAVILTD